MPSGVYSIRNVPTAKLPTVVAEFKAEGATVTTIPQDDGSWTVVAVYAMNAGSPEERGAEKHA